MSDPRSLHHRHGHHGWDRSLSPAVEITSGQECELVLADCFGGQLSTSARSSDVAQLDLDVANPLTGPVAIDGAQPGDVLDIEVVELVVGEIGWTAVIPGFGLLADEFEQPHVVVSHISADHVAFGDLARLELRPFLGTIGVAPAQAGTHSVIPPRRVGGNLDCRDVRAGARLLLPVEVDGGLLSAGDSHAAQGDGEVCGTAVETTATVRLRVHVRRDVQIDTPQIILPSEVPSPRGPRHITTGVGPDLYAGARAATRAMIDHLVSQFGLDEVDAYALCSVAADLRIAEIVDAPNWVVAMDFDLSVLRR